VPNEPRRDAVPDYFPDELPLYQVGQLVLHRRYGYRGVVVDFDMACQAPEDWYARNNTQPERAQPWYHVLVDGSDAATYAAQTSLVHDPMPRPIEHAWVLRFFTEFHAGRYLRNEDPWLGW